MMYEVTYMSNAYRNMINTNENYEVEYWATKFGITAQQLKAAVEMVGNSAAIVQQHLGK